MNKGGNDLNNKSEMNTQFLPILLNDSYNLDKSV